ncbi:hypothetical protein BJY01DRAFT_110946 [Aspergillus pseudoustus]|uniref:Secreted protein n=1 Tax=Aspergillus pseudoustus TaxID=1810923 RepID=A0ABR4ITD4_9EURO
MATSAAVLSVPGTSGPLAITCAYSLRPGASLHEGPKSSSSWANVSRSSLSHFVYHHPPSSSLSLWSRSLRRRAKNGTPSLLLTITFLFSSRTYADRAFSSRSHPFSHTSSPGSLRCSAHHSQALLSSASLLLLSI